MNTVRSSSLPFLVLVLVLALVVRSAAAPVDLDAQMREIAAGLRCPVCQNLSVADSSSELARDMRALIVDQLRAGRTPEDIRAYFVSKYGPWILLSPPARGIGLLVWALPALASLAALAGAALALRRWARRRVRTPAGGPDAAAVERVRALVSSGQPAGTLAAEEATLVEALRELEFDHCAGKLSAADYEELRGLYERRAAEALARADRARPATTARPSADDPEAPRVTRPPRRVWRTAAAAVGLVGFGVAAGFLLNGALHERGDGSITGGALTGTRQAASRVDLTTRDVGTLLGEGQRALERQDYPTAMKAFARALEIDPDQPVANAYAGLLLHKGGHSDRAFKAFERALAREPRLAPALWGKGLVLYEARGRVDEALQVWQQLLTLELSDDDRAHVERTMAEARAKVARASTPPARR